MEAARRSRSFGVDPDRGGGSGAVRPAALLRESWALRRCRGREARSARGGALPRQGVAHRRALPPSVRPSIPAPALRRRAGAGNSGAAALAGREAAAARGGGLPGLGFAAEKACFYIPVSNQLGSGGAACGSKWVVFTSWRSKWVSLCCRYYVIMHATGWKGEGKAG